MKDISVKKQGKLEEIFSRAHAEIDPEDAIDRMGHSSILASMDSQKAKAEAWALSRKDILDKVDKWMLAREEESWVEGYSQVLI